MGDAVRLGPADVFAVEAREDAGEGGSVVTYTCRLRRPLADTTFHRLHGWKVSAVGGTAFAAGYWYTEGPADTFGRPARLPFPYNTYRRVKWPVQTRGGDRYCAVSDLKLPLLAAGGNGSPWFGLVVEPWLHIGTSRIPIFCSVQDTGASRVLLVGVFGKTPVHVDRHPWFGLRRDSDVAHGPQVLDMEFTFRVCEVQAEDWPALVAQACSCPLVTPPTRPPAKIAARLQPAMDRAWRFYSRVKDHEHGALVHLVQRNGPNLVSAEFKHSHITPELHTLALAADLAGEESPAAVGLRDALRTWCLAPLRSVQTADSRRWHTATRLTVGGLRAFTHHGAGFVGFPGGQATNVRHLAETYQRMGDDDLADAALQTARWVLRYQRSDGSWPTSVPVADDVSLKAVGGNTACVAATAESVRAMLAAYQVDNERAWLDAAERGLEFVNREAAYFSCRGYLRDAAPREPDGLTAECAIQANLDRAQFGPPEPYVAHATRWGWYAAQWVRPLAADAAGAWMVDGLSHTITPRIDVWGALLLGLAWARLAQVTGDATWQALAWRQLHGCLPLQEADGGFAETWWYDWPAGILPVPMESTFLATAFLDLARVFHQDWSPPEQPAETPAQVLPGERVEGPDGLVFEFREATYASPFAGLYHWLLREARTGPPRNLAGQTLGLVRLLTGGELAAEAHAPAPLRRVVVRYEHQARQARVWRWRYALSSPLPEDTLVVPRLYVRGIRTCTVDGDSMRVITADGDSWRIRATAPGNVAPHPDGTLRFDGAVNWNAAVTDFPVQIECRRVKARA